MMHGTGSHRPAHGAGGYTGRYIPDAQRSELMGITQRLRMPDGTPNKKIRWRIAGLGLLAAMCLYALVNYLVPDRDVEHSVDRLVCTVADDTMEFSAMGLTVLDDEYETYEVRLIALDLYEEVAVETVIIEFRGPVDITETVGFISIGVRDTCEIEVRGLTP